MTAFVTHTCKNSKTLIPTGKIINSKGEMIPETKMLCFNGFMEEDTIGVTTIPSKAYYCPEMLSCPTCSAYL